MSEAVPSLVCTSCGTSFQPSAALLERYPGWRPKQCTACHRTSRGSSDRARRSRQPSSDAAQPLTLAQVLERYDDGPQDGVFTDGSATPNPGPGGWGAVYVVGGEIVDQAWGQEAHTTNNRMELTALLRGVELVPLGTPMVVYTDSNLAVRTVTEWASGWAANGWKRKRGPVENLDLVRPLYETFQRRPELELRWIAAHAGHLWNEYADSLASAYARDEL